MGMDSIAVTIGIPSSCEIGFVVGGTGLESWRWARENGTTRRKVCVTDKYTFLLESQIVTTHESRVRVRRTCACT